VRLLDIKIAAPISGNRLEWAFFQLGLMKRGLLVLSAICSMLILSCGENTVSEASEEENTPAVKGFRKSGSAYPIVKLSVPLFQIREAPDVESRGLSNLQKGDPLELLGPVSEQVTRLTIGEKTFYQPWLLVRTQAGAEGWVHAAVVTGEVPEGLRLKALVGKVLAREASEYAQAFNEMASAATVVQTIRLAHQLCEQLTIVMQLQPPEMASEVASLLPALTVSWVEAANSWQFYVDYKTFETAARRSGSAADDALLELYYSAYPVDSIGYLYPAWKLEVDDRSVFSLLGKGIHTSFLSQLDQMSPYRDIAGPEIDQLKARLINDMTEPAVLYWEAREKVQQELESILDTTFTVLTPADTLALHQSLMVVRDTVSARQRRFNFRAGH